MSEQGEQGNAGNNDSGDSDHLATMEAEAKIFGWVPKDDFRGDESQWIDAETFVKRGREINPILKKNNDRLMQELRKRDGEIAEMRGSLDEFGKMYTKMSETAYQRAIQDVKAQLRNARTEGDVDLVEQLEEQRDALVEESKNIKPPVKPAPQQQQVNPQAQQALQDWVGENKWYNQDKNPDMVFAADGIALKLSKSRPDLVGTRAFLDNVTDELKRVMPDRFKNPNRAAGSPVAGGTSGASQQSKGKKGYNDLPADAKLACDRMTTPGKPGFIKGFTKDKYVQNYFEE